MKSLTVAVLLLTTSMSFAQTNNIGVFDGIGEVSGQSVTTVTVQTLPGIIDVNTTLQELTDQCEIKFKKAIDGVHSIGNAIIVSVERCKLQPYQQMRYSKVMKAEINFIR